MQSDKCISPSSTTTAKNQLTINDLDDDSLGMIFNKLPYIDRTRIESVCRRWYAISTANWCTYSKCLRIGEDTDDFLPSYDNATDEECKSALEKVLQRSGPYLEEIIFSQECGFDTAFESGTIKWITELCPKLKRLTTGGLILNNDDCLACSNLEALCLTFLFEKGTEILGLLFRSNKRLRRLAIVRSDSLNDSDFDHLDPGQLQCLQIDYCDYEFTAVLADKLAESLVELKYSFCWDYTPNLQHLGKLKHLRSLDLKVGIEYLETNFTADILKNCRKLERLFLVIFSGHVYDPNVFDPLFDLPYLRRLVIILNKNHFRPREDQRNKLMQRGTHLEFFVIDTCIKCDYGSSILDPCCCHYRGWLS